MRFICTLLFLFFYVINLGANNIQAIKEGPIHEAFVTQEYGNEILEAVPDKPPPPITEEKPRMVEENAVWIPGYWSWSRDVGEYIWVSGVWRKAPPKHHWIPGRWKNYQFGWVWLKGFWSMLPESEFVYIPEPPPTQINESVPPPPKPDTYFWVSGHWVWQPEAHAYRWFAGRWSLFESNMLYIPPQYYWRENGYLFVPGFWDWPIEKRGVVFANLAIPSQERESLVYEPNMSLNPTFIMEKLFPYWPNYASLFRYHFHFHQALWIAWGPIPPWWHWATWWCLPVQDSWGLWWWWSHPNYPNPNWMTEALAEKIVPPNEMAITLMKNVTPPPIMTPNGAIGSHQLIEAIEKATGKKNPILSSDPMQVEQVQALAQPHVPKPPYLRPTGKQRIIEPPLKPNSDSTFQELKLYPGRVKPLAVPPSEDEGETEKEIAQTPEAAPTPKAPPTPRARPPFHPTKSYQPRETTPPAFHHHEVPFQGSKPFEEGGLPQIQTQHHDTFMSRPQPQRNPTNPSST